MDRENGDVIEEDEVDLLLQHSEREQNVLQFLQALDLQVIGACRSDERLFPLLKTNISNCAAEDRLLANLIQHFEATEIGMLARCLCMPLVSIRVGRIVKQDGLLCPTSVRGMLNLTLLPSSNLRISFTGDDGCSERLATLSGNCKNSAATVDDIPADTSGRSFVLKLPTNQMYFWCSEKSKHLGNELLAKMNDVLERKPSLAELTGISETRLDCFAIHFREYLLGSNVTNTQTNQVSSVDTSPEQYVLDSSSSTPLSGPQHITREILMADMHSISEHTNFPSVPKTGVTDSNTSDNKKPIAVSTLGFFDTTTSLNQLLQDLPSSRGPSAGSFVFTPHYCFCPPCTSTLSEAPSNISNSFPDCFPLPPLSSLLPHNLVNATSLDLSPFLSDSVSGSQQIPTFIPLMCEPIVHIPSIGVCSSGQGYLVGAGPSTIPLDSDSMVEKGARETLQLLLSTTQSTPWSRDVVFPSVFGELDSKRGESTNVEAFLDSIGSMDFCALPYKSVCSDFDCGNQTEGSDGLERTRSDDSNSSIE
ncbi:hypothetical protein ACHQM5_013764 [Ranunculus cassubicifolius]